MHLPLIVGAVQELLDVDFLKSGHGVPLICCATVATDGDTFAQVSRSVFILILE